MSRKIENLKKKMKFLNFLKKCLSQVFNFSKPAEAILLKIKYFGLQ